MSKIGALESLFNRLGELRTESRKGQTLVVMRASGCAREEEQVAPLGQNIDAVLTRMITAAQGEVYRLDRLDYGLILNDKTEAARQFIPNVKVALFKVLSKIGAGGNDAQSTTNSSGLVFEHYNLDTDFAAAAKIVVAYGKASRAGQGNDGAGRELTEHDLKKLIDGYRKAGADKFLKTFCRGQQVCVLPERGPVKTKMTEYFIGIDSLKKPFFDGVDLSENSDRFGELTKILDTIMLNSFDTLVKRAEGQKLSINLNIPSVFSKAFDNFIASTSSDVMRNVVIEFRQADAVLNYDGYAIARDHLRSKGAQIAIDQITPSAIGLVNIGFLEAQIAKLQWHPNAEEDLYENRELIEKLRKSGIQPVLRRVDVDRAKEIGSDLGIEMYQGFLIDGMLKAEAAAA